MNKWLGFSGWLGLILFLFGLVGGFLTDFRQPLMLAHIVLGLALLIVWFLAVGLRNISQTRQAVLGRRARYGYSLVVYAALFLLVLVTLNWIVSRHDRRWDTTREGVYSLAGQSEQVIRNLQAPLKLVLLTNTGAIDDEKTKQLFELYRYNNPSKVSLEYVDPRAKPHLLDRYEMKQGNLVYIEYGEGDARGVNRLNEAGETAVTNAILKLARGVARKIYFVRGHDEPDIEDDAPQGLKNLAQAIGDENLKMEGVFLGEKESVPEDASAVVLASPRKALLPSEVELLIKYVEAGGRLLMLTDPRGSADVKSIAARFGIEIGENVVIDQIQRLFAAPALGAQPVVTDYDRASPITKGMTQNDVTIFNIASSVRIAQQKVEGAKYTELLRTGPTAWGESDMAMLFDSSDPTAVFDQGRDLQGPISLAVSFEKEIQSEEASKEAGSEPRFDKSSRVVVVGDSDWLLNANLHVYANRDLVLNAINWLIGEEGGISIRPRAVTAQAQPVRSEALALVMASSFVVPELFLIFGLFIWWRRRRLSA